jgi:hypothetical protein
MTALHRASFSAALFVLGISLGACGGGEHVAAPTTSSVASGGSGKGGTPNDGGKDSDDGDTEGGGTAGSSTDGGDADGGSEEGFGCDEAGGCTAYVWIDESGQPFLCSDLRVVVVRLQIIPSAAPPRAVTVLTTRPTFTGLPVRTSTAPASTTTRQETVTRPQCRPGAKSVPVTGLDIDAISDLRRSNDGKTAWTPTKVRLLGRIANGEFVAGG